MIAAPAPRRTALAFLLGLLAAFVVVTVLWFATGGGDRSGFFSTGGSELPIDVGLESFTMTGSLDTALQPGSTSAIDLELTNSSDREVRIRDLAVTVVPVRASSATASLTCTVEDFTTTPATGAVLLASDSGASLSALGLDEWQWPQVAMLSSTLNQDGCKNAILSLAFTTTGETS